MKRILKSRTINRVILILLILFIAGDCFVSYKRFKNLVDNVYERQIQSVAEIVVEQQNDEISFMVSYLKSQVKILANMVSADGEPTKDSVRETLEAVSGSTYGDIIFSNGNGEAIDSNGDTFDISKKRYFKKVMKGETVVSESTISARDGDNVIIVATPIEYDNEYVGAVCCVLPLETISNILSDDFMNEIGNIILTQSDGKVIASTRNDIKLGENIEDNEEFAGEVGKENLKREKTKDESGDISYIGRGDNSYVTEIYNEESGWTLISIINTRQLENYSEELNKDILLYMFTFIGRILGMMVLFILVLLNDMRIAWGVTKELESQKDIMEFKALHDPMTGLYNKARFEYIAKQEIETNRRGKNALFFIDIDDFKHFNDTYGHAAGDELLKGFAGVLKTTFRDGDFLARYGGDEFVVLVNGYYEKDNIEMLAKRLFEHTAKKHFESFDEPITLSVGIAEKKPDDTLDELTRRADEALYKSKNSGKNQYTFAEQ